MLARDCENAGNKSRQLSNGWEQTYATEVDEMRDVRNLNWTIDDRTVGISEKVGEIVDGKIVWIQVQLDWRWLQGHMRVVWRVLRAIGKLVEFLLNTGT